jgi:hypothetical protein
MARVTESHPIGMDELRAMARERFGDLVKGVVDLRRGVLVLDAELHADQEAELLAEGSARPTSEASTSTRICPAPTGWSSIR